MDPLSTAAGAFIGKAAGGAAVGKLSGGLLAKAIEALKGPELDRVLDAVDEELGIGVGTAGLTFLRDDPDIALMIVLYLGDRTSWDEGLMVAAIEPHVAPGEQGTARDHALRIARAIERNAFKAQKDKTAAVVREVQAVRGDLGRLADQLAHPLGLITDSLPREALAPLQDLAETSPGEATALEQSLTSEATRVGEIRGLISSPPAWVEEGSSALWATLSDLAQAYGLIDLAQRAALDAASRPGADRARMFARAADLARVQGDEEQAEALLNDARGVNPDHPSVRVAESYRTPDAQARLDLLDGVEPLTPRQAAAIESSRALSYLSLGRDEEATAAAQRAMAVNADLPAVRELGPVITLISNQRRLRDDSVDWKAVRAAGDEFVALRDELDSLGRHREASRMRARAAESYTLAGDRSRAVELVESIPTQEQDALDEDGARHLAEAALDAHRPDLAEMFLASTGQSDAARLLRAQVEVHQGPERALAVVEELDQLLDSEEAGVREQASLTRTLTALMMDEVPWSDEAESIMRGVDEVITDAMVASRLARAGDVDGARVLLVSHADDPRALRALVDLAADAEDWPAAVELQASLVGADTTPHRRLRLAELLALAGRSQEAEQSLDVLRHDTSAPVDVQAEATARLAALLWRSQRYVDLVDVASDWLALEGHSPAAAWALVLSLAAVSRYGDALAVINDRELEPRDERDGLLAANVFRRTLEPADAIRRIIELSDRFDRQVEGLEAMVIHAGIGPRGRGLPEEIEERRSETFATFLDRFPNSQYITAIPAPETEEEIEDFLREHFSQGSADLADIQRAMIRGETAVAVLAASASRNVSRVWSRLGALPLEFGDPALTSIERAAALDAVTRGVVWETSALYIVGGLGPEIEEVVRRALPGSVVPQTVLDDAAAGADQPFADEEGIELGWDSDTDRPQVRAIDEEQRQIDQLSAEGVLRLARALRVVPAVDAGSPGRYDEVLADGDGGTRDIAFRTWVAAFAVAERLGFSLYSDDRFVRAHAHGAGIQSFGTPALLDALVDRGLLDPALRERALRRLRLSGAMGLAPSADQLVREAEETDWDINPLVARAMFDPTAWRDVSGLSKHVQFLHEAFRRSLETFPIWVERVHGAARTAVRPEFRNTVTASLLVLAWVTEDREFGLELLRLFRQVDPLDDPLVPAFAILGRFINPAPTPVRLLGLRAAFNAVEGEDHRRLFALLRFDE